MRNDNIDLKVLQKVMEDAVTIAKQNHEGHVADYIPELASVDLETTAISVMLKDGTVLTAGYGVDVPITLQSAAKLIVLIGLLEELGPEEILKWTMVEPSGGDFASITRLVQFGPKPSNPMLNSGAIALCAHVPGNAEERIHWLEGWTEKLFGMKLSLDAKVFASERRTGDKNRALAYLLKNQGMLTPNVDDVLETYFYLCSFLATVRQASYLPMLLSNGGVGPDGKRVFSLETTRMVVAIMSTCGLYNETGTHMVNTGLPAKSSVSGYILASALQIGGIAVNSPRVSEKGTSLRGEIMLEYLSKAMSWHFAC